MGRIRIFICHASDDGPLVDPLRDLLKTALNLPAGAIRCTSAAGFDLPFGVNTAEKLRFEIHECEVFIWVVTPRSLKSPYVMFESGARWGSDKPLLPLLAPGIDPNILGPLIGINALRPIATDVRKLVKEVAGVLGVNADDEVSYDKHVQQVVSGASALPVDEGTPATFGSLFRRDLSAAEREATDHLREECWQLLKEVDKSRAKELFVRQSAAGFQVTLDNVKDFVVNGSARSEAKWRSAVRELAERGLIESTDPEGRWFRISDLGYQVLTALTDDGDGHRIS